MELLADRDVAKVYHASWAELLDVVPSCDALIVDAPYSERTHAGHDSGSKTANKASATSLRYGSQARVNRRDLGYGAWDATDVAGFVSAWAPRCDGWFVSITDHSLAPAWASSLEESGLYVFSPIACVAPGSRVRMSGDGPSQWSCFAIVARPKRKPFSIWGALPGAYVVPPGALDLHAANRVGVVGGKPLWLMERLVEDYSRPGQLVVDPCCGAGTTVTAAIRTGRRAVGGDAMREHAELAAKAVGGMQQAPLFCGGAA